MRKIILAVLLAAVSACALAQKVDINTQTQGTLAAARVAEDSRYQPADSDLTAIAALSTTSYGRALLALADAAALRTAAGLGTAATSNTGDFDAAGAAAAAQAASQPLDSDLTAIAALSTTSYGRAFLALADAAAGRTALGLGALATVTPGTGVATALAVNVGTAGAPVVNGGALGTPSSGNAANLTGFPTLNQNTTGSAATLTTPRAIFGYNFDGSAPISSIISSAYGGTGNGFTKFTGPTTTERTFTLPDSNATLLYSGGPGGTPSSITLTNATGTASGLTAGNVTTNANLTGDVTSVGNATTIANGIVTLAKIANASASSKLLGSGASGSGAAYAELTLGTNLSMSGTTLNAAGGGLTIGTTAITSGTTTRLLYDNAGVVGESAGLTTDGNVLTNTQAVAATSTDGYVLATSTAATVGAQKYSPRIRWLGSGWKTNATAGAQNVEFIAEVQPVQGAANPTGKWSLQSQVNGGGFTERASVDTNGLLTLSGSITSSGASPRFTNAGTGSIGLTSNGTIEWGGGVLTIGGSGGITLDQTIVTGTRFQDADSVNLKIIGAAAWSSSTNRNGGSILLDGGAPSGTGTSGDIIVGTTRGRLIAKGGKATATVAKTSNYTATISDYQIECDATTGVLTVTLPALSTVAAGQEYILVKTDASANACIFDGNASETINGATTVSTTTQYGVLRIKANAAKNAWYGW